MATKIRIMRMLQEIRGLAEITHRRPHVRQPGLFLIQLRSQVGGGSPSRGRLTILVDMQDPPDIPHPVKITHIPIGAGILVPS